MKQTLILTCSLILCSILIASGQTPSAKRIQVGDTLRDDAIIAPEKSDDELGKLLHDWQINFAKNDTDCRSGGDIVYSDSVYINRLYNIPSEMELVYNPIVRKYIDMYTGRRRELVGYMMTLGKYYFPMFEEILDRHQIPLELKYLPVIESALNPVAVSRVGATGLWQFMLRTGKNYGLKINSLVDERRDPYKASEAAAKFLKDLYRIYDDWNLVIAAYNCGPGNVNKAIARSGGKRDYWAIYYHLPRETRGYVPAFIAANYAMNYAALHNICPVKPTNNNMLALDTIHVSREMHFAQIAGVLELPIDELRRLNPQFKRDVIPGNHKSYALVLPTQKMYAFIENKEAITNFDRHRYFTHRSEASPDSRYTSAKGTYTKNVYYRVKRGDNLGKIARRNRTTVAQLKRWNGLRSTKIRAGKRLIVRKRVATPSQKKSSKKKPLKNEATQKQNNSSGTVVPSKTKKDRNVISNYLKENIKR